MKLVAVIHVKKGEWLLEGVYMYMCLCV